MPAEANSPLLRHPLLLWSGWVVGPAAWSLHLMASYLLVEWVCLTDNEWALHAVTLATALLSAAGAWVAWRQWTLAGRRWPGAGIQRAERIRFMTVVGLLLSVLSTLIILAEGIPNFIIGACL
jgi:hypothetical protein